jgi:hypothetical protein
MHEEVWAQSDKTMEVSCMREYRHDKDDRWQVTDAVRKTGMLDSVGPIE